MRHEGLRDDLTQPNRRGVSDQPTHFVELRGASYGRESVIGWKRLEHRGLLQGDGPIAPKATVIGAYSRSE